MKRLFALTLALVTALCSSPAPVSAYIPADDDYLCDAPTELSFFNFNRWQPYERPLKVYLTPPPYTFAQSQAYAATLQQAFLSWTKAAPAFTFVFVKDPRQAQIQIKWLELLPESEGDLGKVLFPQASFDARRRLVHKSLVHLPLKQRGLPALAPDEIGQPEKLNQARYFSTQELLPIALHAIGHALGLPHSRFKDDIMNSHLFADLDAAANKISQRDAVSLNRLYVLPARLEGSPCNG